MELLDGVYDILPTNSPLKTELNWLHRWEQSSGFPIDRSSHSGGTCQRPTDFR